MENEGKGGGRSRGLKSSFAAGVAALIFIIVGYQSALFVHKASVLKILERRDVPDTVFVIDEALAERILQKKPETKQENVRGQKTYTVRKNASHEAGVESVRSKATPRQVESFRFNPNTVSVPDLVRLGFSEKQALSIDTYRKKGGMFRRKSDFAKSFVVADTVYARLEPYIDIPKIDLNLADSADFDTLPGIGGYFASKMVQYRQRLGGSYSNKEQLLDIYRFDEEKFSAIEDLIEVSQKNVRPYPLWTLPADSLKLHPYIGSYSARAIVIYRENHPVSAWTVEGLKAAGVLKAEYGEKLGRCAILPPPG